MTRSSIIYVVHCVDTEGPLKENISATFKRLKEIYNISLKPTKQNLIKIQNKELKFNGKEKIIAKTFDRKLLNYNRNWTEIELMQKKLLSKNFRNKFKDSFKNGWIYNWFIMDHVGFKENPRKRHLGFHKIWNRYKSFYKKNNNFKDGFHFHHHPVPFSRSANHCATHFFSHKPSIYEILNRKLIDLSWFPSVFRPGFHAIRPDSHWFLEQFIPFDYSNQSMKHKKNDFQRDLSGGRFGDWRRASSTWGIYHPHHDDYQKKGDCRRWTARCLNIGTRHRLLKRDDVKQAFLEAKKGKPVILAFTNHDYRDMESDIDHVANLIKSVSKYYPKIKYRWCEAREAMRLALNLKKKKTAKIKQIIRGNVFHLKVDKKIYGPQPYLAIQTKNGNYFHDNFDIQKPFFEWTYTFDEHTIPKNNIKKIAWAANDNYGSTYVSVIDPKKFKIINRVL